MTDLPRADDAPPTPRMAGERLRAAREAAGLSLAAVADRTRIPLRHLEAMENGSYEGLPSKTYAVGFARAYARAVGADEVAIARDVREEVARLGRRTPEYEPYVTADPARLPSRATAIIATGIALAVIILAGLWWGASHLGGGGAPASAPATPSAVARAPVPPRPARPAGGQVTLTAADTVWLRVYDAANKTLFLGTMKPGDKFDVPANADHPQINVGRPDKLTVTLNGSAVPPLGDGSHAIKDVAVDGASIAARLANAPAPISSASATPLVTPTHTAAPERRPVAHHAEPRASGGGEVERANRAAARAAEHGVVPPVPTTTP